MKLYSIGFTGTRRGMTVDQIEQAKMLIEAFVSHGAKSVHHGMCIGADEQFHNSLTSPMHHLCIYGHPAQNIGSMYRANVRCTAVFPVKHPLKRNHDIVDQTDVLIAAPRARAEELRSGTWATVRYARKQGKTVYILWHDGGRTREGEATYEREPVRW